MKWLRDLQVIISCQTPVSQSQPSYRCRRVCFKVVSLSLLFIIVNSQSRRAVVRGSNFLFWIRSCCSCSSRLFAYLRLESTVCLTILPLAGRRSDNFYPFFFFLRELTQSECKQAQPKFELCLPFSFSVLFAHDKNC